MTLESIKKLAIGDIAYKNCVLFLWTIETLLPQSFEVIKSWGFEYKTVAFTWIKTNKINNFWYGMGYWTRCNPEQCLLATKGHPKRISKDVEELTISPRREHSRKPDEIRNKIVRLCGDLPRIELFARQKTPGWDVWGNEVESDIDLLTPTEKGQK